MPPKKRKPKITPGQLRGIVREMSQPPNNARRRSVVPQTKLVTRRRGENPPRSGKVKRTETGVKKTPATIAQERYQAGQMRLQRMAQQLQQPTKRKVTGQVPAGLAKPKVQKPRRQQTVTTRARSKPRLMATSSRTGRRLVGIDLRVLPELVSKGIISQSEANAIRNAAEGRRGSNYNLSSSARDTSNILKRELNLTPAARARLDAEEARLAREEQLSRNKQYEESKRNRRVQNPMREPSAMREAERRVLEGLRAIERAERQKKKLQKKLPSRPIAPRTSTGGMIPMAPGAGGGLLPRIR